MNYHVRRSIVEKMKCDQVKMIIKFELFTFITTRTSHTMHFSIIAPLLLALFKILIDSYMYLPFILIMCHAMFFYDR